jgi:hypothetical protein
MICKFVEEVWMISLIWFTPKRGQNKLFIIMVNYLKFSYFEVDKKINDQVELMDSTII